MDEKLLDRMTAKLNKLVTAEDSVRIYALCAKCESVAKVLGKGELSKDENVFIL
jgi:CRISPR-associated endonuclease Cas2